MTDFKLRSKFVQLIKISLHFVISFQCSTVWNTFYLEIYLYSGTTSCIQMWNKSWNVFSTLKSIFTNAQERSHFVDTDSVVQTRSRQTFIFVELKRVIVVIFYIFLKMLFDISLSEMLKHKFVHFIIEFEITIFVLNRQLFLSTCEMSSYKFFYIDQDIGEIVYPILSRPDSETFLSRNEELFLFSWNPPSRIC